jgi:hypothetical protein
MDQDFVADAAPGLEAIDDPAAEGASGPFLGRWNRLVSTTNWEKGRIICQWREALAAAGAAPQSATDEAWSRRVGNLTPQHCGRLRRVWQRFGAGADRYPGLYWSHFHAALEWSDAEMWLEGAVQNDWSVAQMVRQRSATLDALEGPADAAAEAALEIPPEVWDDDAPVGREELPETISSSPGEVHEAADGASLDAAGASAEPSAAEPLRPFEGLPPLPADLQDAFEAFKLAIVRQRQAGWVEISCRQVLAVLDALREFARQPAEP